MKLAAFAALALLTPGVAAAETYYVVAKAPLGVLMINADTLTRNGERVGVWSTLFLAHDGGDGQATDPHTAMIMTRDEFDCAGGQSRHTFLQAYNARGEPTTTAEVPDGWQVTVPGSIADTQQKLICKPLNPAEGIQAKPLDMLIATRHLP